MLKEKKLKVHREFRRQYIFSKKEIQTFLCKFFFLCLWQDQYSSYKTCKFYIVALKRFVA